MVYGRGFGTNAWVQSVGFGVLGGGLTMQHLGFVVRGIGLRAGSSGVRV
jgi:hypothetical protein